ncbi:unnamed protein product, partial [Ectocarpus sp. 4 AP-2014]
LRPGPLIPGVLLGPRRRPHFRVGEFHLRHDRRALRNALHRFGVLWNPVFSRVLVRRQRRLRCQRLQRLRHALLGQLRRDVRWRVHHVGVPNPLINGSVAASSRH